MDFQIFKLKHRGMNCFGVKLDRKDARNNAVRNLSSIRWSGTHCCWYGQATDKLMEELKGIERGTNSPGNTETKKLPAEELTINKQQSINRFVKWLQSKRYSTNTIKAYQGALTVFLNFFNEKAISEINREDHILFNNEYILANDLSASYQNQIVNAIKLFYKIIENTNITVELIERPRREHRLPNVLSREEIKSILDEPRNLKHKAMLSLIYACGLRRGELTGLLPSDIDSKRGVLRVNQSKGNKDRIVPLGTNIVELLREYYKQFKPQKWLFEGAIPGEQYGERSLQLVLKQAVSKAGINKPVTLHWLRHSYATHLHESGTDIRFIQELLGHNSSRTTEIYTHVSTRSIEQIRSPFDDL